MEREEFKIYLIAASYLAIQGVKIIAKEKCPCEFIYDIELNQSADVRTDKEFIYYPEDDGKVYLQQSVDDAVTLLVRDGKIPVWIDIFVKASTSKTTTLQLECAGRFTNQKAQMYYSPQGYGPFGIKNLV